MAAAGMGRASRAGSRSHPSWPPHGRKPGLGLVPSRTPRAASGAGGPPQREGPLRGAEGGHQGLGHRRAGPKSHLSVMLWADGQVSRKRTDPRGLRAEAEAGTGSHDPGNWGRSRRCARRGGSRRHPQVGAGLWAPPPRRGDDRAGVMRARGQPRSLALAARQRRPTGAAWPAAPCAPVSFSGNVTRAAAHAGNAGRSLHSSVRPSLHSFTPPGACELLLCTRLCTEAQDATAVGAECLSQAPEPSGPFYLQSSRHPSTLPALGLHPRRVEQRPRPRPRHSWLGEPLLSLQMSPAVTSPKGPSLGLSPGGVRGGSSSQQA